VSKLGSIGHHACSNAKAVQHAACLSPSTCISPSSMLVSRPVPAECTTRNVGSSIPLRANAVCARVNCSRRRTVQANADYQDELNRLWQTCSLTCAMLQLVFATAASSSGTSGTADA
jgi:hypothetical protein